MSSCGIKGCSYYILLGAISGAMLYLILIIAMVLYLANTSMKSGSPELDKWRDTELGKIESEYPKPEGFQGSLNTSLHKVQTHTYEELIKYISKYPEELKDHINDIVKKIKEIDFYANDPKSLIWFKEMKDNLDILFGVIRKEVKYYENNCEKVRSSIEPTKNGKIDNILFKIKKSIELKHKIYKDGMSIEL